MATVSVPETLWSLIEPLLPIRLPKPQGGRPRLADRACLAGIIFVLRSGIPWRMLPKRLGCGSGMTCWRRLRDWQQDGIWDLIRFVLLDWLSRDGQIDWSRAVLDSCSAQFLVAANRAKSDGRAEQGSKRNLICDGFGIARPIKLTGAKLSRFDPGFTFARCHSAAQRTARSAALSP